MAEIAVITSFHRRGYEAYGKRFLETFDRWWPDDVVLYVYAEDVSVAAGERIVVRDLHANCPALVEFKTRHGHRAVSDWRMDAVRFANKVFATLHGATNAVEQLVFWIDADVVTFAPVPRSFLRSCLPDGVYTCCLQRRGKHSECGFVGYNTRHTAHADFMHRFARYYTSGAVFGLAERHDSYVYDIVRTDFERQGRIATKNLSGDDSGNRHPFINSPLGCFMDHLKGTRKRRGKSKPTDLRGPRGEPYWAAILHPRDASTEVAE